MFDHRMAADFLPAFKWPGVVTFALLLTLLSPHLGAQVRETGLNGKVSQHIWGTIKFENNPFLHDFLSVFEQEIAN